MNNVCKAIATRTLCRFVYNGQSRTVEIYCHGLSSTGKELIRTYEPASSTWKLFEVPRLIDFARTLIRFDVRPDYRPRDPAIVTLCCGIDR